ncbi:MAG: hypothetical protein M1820_007012 [Bogoriella megaspora]|nr:MAG: hypothetical protein M1820_007012 [Bogoriella megaspora]
MDRSSGTRATSQTLENAEELFEIPLATLKELRDSDHHEVFARDRNGCTLHLYFADDNTDRCYRDNPDSPSKHRVVKIERVDNPLYDPRTQYKLQALAHSVSPDLVAKVSRSHAWQDSARSGESSQYLVTAAFMDYVGSVSRLDTIWNLLGSRERAKITDAVVKFTAELAKISYRLNDTTQSEMLSNSLKDTPFTNHDSSIMDSSHDGTDFGPGHYLIGGPHEGWTESVEDFLENLIETDDYSLSRTADDEGIVISANDWCIYFSDADLNWLFVHSCLQHNNLLPDNILVHRERLQGAASLITLARITGWSAAGIYPPGFEFAKLKAYLDCSSLRSTTAGFYKDLKDAMVEAAGIDGIPAPQRKFMMAVRSILGTSLRSAIESRKTYPEEDLVEYMDGTTSDGNETEYVPDTISEPENEPVQMHAKVRGPENETEDICDTVSEPTHIEAGLDRDDNPLAYMQMLARLSDAYLIHGIESGCCSWDVHLSRNLGVVLLVRVLHSPCREIRREIMVNLLYGDVSITFQDGRNLDGLAMYIKFRQPYSECKMKVQLLRGTKYNSICLAKTILIQALRMGAVEARTIDQLIDSTLRRNDRTVRWTHPEYHLLPSFGYSRLFLDNHSPRSCRNTSRWMEEMVKTAGMDAESVQLVGLMTGADSSDKRPKRNRGTSRGSGTLHEPDSSSMPQEDDEELSGQSLTLVNETAYKKVTHEPSRMAADDFIRFFSKINSTTHTRLCGGRAASTNLPPEASSTDTSLAAPLERAEVEMEEIRSREIRNPGKSLSSVEHWDASARIIHLNTAADGLSDTEGDSDCFCTSVALIDYNSIRPRHLHITISFDKRIGAQTDSQMAPKITSISIN